MRRTLTIAIGTAAALVTAAVAFAVAPTIVDVSEATATFRTTTIEKPKVRTCTADARTWETTDAHYIGIVTSGNALLAGALAIHAKTRYSATDKLGYVDGSFQINDGDSRVRGKLSGTINGDQLVGFLTGKARGRHATVYGNLSATFAGGATSFESGEIGANGSKAPLAILAGPVCKMPKPENEKKAEKPKNARKSVEAKGDITGLADGTPATITVTGKKGPVTCNVDADYPIPAGFPVGTKDVEMKCEAAGDPAVWTLRKLKQHGHH